MRNGRKIDKGYLYKLLNNRIYVGDAVHKGTADTGEGTYASMRDLAAAEAISPTYISRLLRLTLLAPEIVEAILDGCKPETVTQEVLFQPLPDEWHRQQ